MTTEEFKSGPKGRLPNSRFPLLVHRKAVRGGGKEAVLGQFRENGWSNNWFYPGIYTYAHFHSTTHECLGCAEGWMDVRILGGDGPTIRVEQGDVIVMPAGVSHEMIDNSDDNMMVGGYPEGRDWDNVQEEFLSEDRFYQAAKLIMSLPIPAADPVSGKPIHQWIDAMSSVDGGWNDYRDGLDASA